MRVQEGGPKDKCLIGFDGVEVRRVDLPSRATFQATLLVRISFRKERDKGKVRNI